MNCSDQTRPCCVLSVDAIAKKCPKNQLIEVPNRLCGDMLWARPIDQIWWSWHTKRILVEQEKSLSSRGLEATDRLFTLAGSNGM